MPDAIKVFVGVPQITGYVEAAGPPNFLAQFQFNAEIKYFVVQNDAIAPPDSETWQYNAAIGDSPGTVYSALYANIVTHCQVMGYPTPGQNDIFVYIPTALSQIFVDVPTLA